MGNCAGVRCHLFAHQQRSVLEAKKTWAQDRAEQKANMAHIYIRRFGLKKCDESDPLVWISKRSKVRSRQFSHSDVCWYQVHVHGGNSDGGLFVFLCICENVQVA